MSQSRWKGQFCKQSKPVNFVSKFKAKHAIEEQSQCLEESQNCFENKVGEGFRIIDLNFLIEQLRLRLMLRLRLLYMYSLFHILSIKTNYRLD